MSGDIEDINDLYDKMPLLNECYMVGGSLGRPPTMTYKHLETILDVATSILKDTKKRMSEKKPKNQVIRDMVRALQLMNKARNEYFEGEPSEPL